MNDNANAARLEARYHCILTLYGLYRLRDNPLIGRAGLRSDLTSLIGQLEARVFPDCFEPDLDKCLASAREIIRQHDGLRRPTP